MRTTRPSNLAWIAFLLFALPSLGHGAPQESPFVSAPTYQSDAAIETKSRGCLSCHTTTDSATMHESPAVRLGCSDCHGGDAAVMTTALPDSSAYKSAEAKAHVTPRHPERWQNGAHPPRTYTLLNDENPAFIRFFNPADYRVVSESCGACHQPIIDKALRSLMATNAMFWGGASYNNGVLPFKNYILGESYTREGLAASLTGPSTSDPHAALAKHGVLPQLSPLPPWELVPPADRLRVFEPGGRVISSLFPETALPNLGGLQLLNEAGRPDMHSSNRGPGTGARIAFPLLNVQKTRLNDPSMWFLGTNDQPGDYRSSGCTSCHVVYANDKDPAHSAHYAQFGHGGQSHSLDPTIDHSQAGHPLEHRFTRSIPTSQCIVCHMHQPNMFMNTFMGYTMWDYEADAPRMWPKEQRYPTPAEVRKINDRNPEGAAPRGDWGDVDFLAKVSEMNPTMKDTQFADYHGHGWNFRAVFKRDRHGTLLDKEGNPIEDADPDKFHKTVQLASAHMDKGMQCVDCHFAQDAHGNGYIYGEVAAAVEIDCVDCHGTVRSYPTLRTSGPAAPPGGNDLSLLRNPDGAKRFEWRGNELYQRSLVDPGLEWRIKLVKDTVTPGSSDYNARAAQAKLMSKDTKAQHWGADVDDAHLAHGNDNMECYSCHTSWTTSCGGCHLPTETNWATERHHYEGGKTRVFATYNPQVARDDMFMLGRRGPVDGGKVAPVRSSSALVVSSTNANREHIYVQQPPISGSGYSSQAFNPHYPHTERTAETKTCDDCHLSERGDNNAIMAQLLLQGTNFVNFVGLNAYVGTQSGIHAVQVTEWDEPQAVIGSYLHRYAYPDYFKKHLEVGKRLQHADAHAGGPAGCVQQRGEYVYSAEGREGLRVYDVAQIANKDISRRIVTAANLKSANATCVVLPTNQPIDPTRNQGTLMSEDNQERPFHPIYNYALITDAEEGLILVNVDALIGTDPGKKGLQRALTYNPEGILKGARHVALGGHYAYIIADAGLIIVNLDTPQTPSIASIVPLTGAHAAALQFRYLFVSDEAGLEVIDVTDPKTAHLVQGSRVDLKHAGRLYLARTYAYVADGADGLAIVDVEQPEHLNLKELYSAGLSDVRDVIVASTNASLFAYLADGAAGLKVLQLTSPDSQPKFYGFSPEPKPELIASYATRTPALSLSKGLDRDRAVDETGHQIAVFGRRGAGPFSLEEMRRLYLDQAGKPWFAQPAVKP